MKNTTALLLLALLVSSSSFSQKLVSGNYGPGLKLAFDSTKNKVTGYYENYTGWDEEANAPRFSCVFYLEALLKEKKVKVTSYHPAFKSDDLIHGTLILINNKAISISLPEEHGGCWNVEHFADGPLKFELTEKYTWLQVRYVTAEKTYFYSERSETQKQKIYVLKNDFLCVEKIDGAWAYCSYFGKKVSKGWIKTSDLNNN